MNTELQTLYAASAELHKSRDLALAAGETEMAERIYLAAVEITNAIGRLVVGRATKRATT